MSELTPWEESIKNITDHEPILDENGYVRKWNVFIDANLNGFSYKIKTGYMPSTQKTPDEYSTSEIDSSVLDNVGSISKNFNFKYSLYLNRQI